MEADSLPAKPVPDDINLPEVAVADSHQENNGPPAEALGVPTTDVVQDQAQEVAKADPAPTTLRQRRSADEGQEDILAERYRRQRWRTAIDGMPRGIRVAELCTTELREQLKHSPEGYRPELLPSYRLSAGHGSGREARRVSGRFARWYDMSFRCEVDADATKVVSFAYDVGDPVPKGQWRSRGFPDY
jgi:predicted deacylase